MKDQEVTKSAVTGQYESPETADPKTTYDTVEEHRSVWRKEAERLLDAIELGASENDPGYMDVHTVALTIHIQQLKRP
jgi:hypothetical protein